MITRIKCPVCKSTDTAFLDIDLGDNNMIISQHRCLTCDKVWNEMEQTSAIGAAQINHILRQKQSAEIDLTLTNERLGADIDYLKQKLTQTQNAYHDLSDQLTAAQKEIDELDQENHDLAAQLTQLRETYLYPLNNYLPILVDALGTARPQVLDQAVRHYYQHLHQTGDIQRYEIEIIYFDDEPNTEYANHLETAKSIIEQRETDEGIDTITVYDRKYKYYINPITGEPK